MVTGFFEVSPSTFLPVITLMNSTANRVNTVIATAEPTTHVALRSPSGSLVTGSISAAEVCVRVAARANPMTTNTKTTNVIQKITQYSHSMLLACGPAA